jgi:nucleotide-binding universal stress UspA family protein
MTLISRILVPTDFSDCAKRALEYSVDLASRLAASLILVHVYLPPIVYMPEGVWAMPNGTANLYDQLGQALTQLAAQTRLASSRPVETVLVEGDPAKQIVRMATEKQCDLIVIGTHGRSGLGHLVLGSVAEKVVQRANCPVLTVGPRAEVHGTRS